MEYIFTNKGVQSKGHLKGGEMGKSSTLFDMLTQEMHLRSIPSKTLNTFKYDCITLQSKLK